MREIKFRAWDNEVKKMIDHTSLSPRICEAIYGFDKDDAKTSLELMQYTGIKDVNGVEIYEGDIVKQDYSYGVVEYGRLAFYVVSILEEMYPASLYEHNHPKVIGNLYENPELLK